MVPLTLSVWTPTAFPDYAWCDPTLRDIAFTSSLSGVAVGSCMSVYRTQDGGATWVRDGTTGDIGALYAVDAGEGLAVTVGQNALFQPTVLRSADGGATWDWSIFYFIDPSGTSNEGAVSDAVVVSPSIVVAAGSVWSGEGAFARSDDGGVTWTTVAWLPDALHAIDCDAANCVAVGASGSVHTSSDGGSTWVDQPNPVGTALTDVRIEGTRAFAVGATGIALRSDDAGATWTLLVTGSAADLRRIVVDGDTLIAVGKAGTILRSEDAGATWTPELATTSGDLSSVALRPDGAAFAGGVEEMLLRTEIAIA